MLHRLFLTNPVAPTCGIALLSGLLLLWGRDSDGLVRLVSLATLPAAFFHLAALLPEAATLVRFSPSAITVAYAASGILAAIGARSADGFPRASFAVEAMSGVFLGLGIAAFAGRLVRQSGSTEQATRWLAVAGGLYGLSLMWTTWFDGGALPLGVGSIVLVLSLAVALARRGQRSGRERGKEIGEVPLSFERAARGIAHAILKPVSLADEQLGNIARRTADAELRQEIESAADVVGQVKRFVRDLVDLARPGEQRRKRSISLQAVMDQALAEIVSRSPEARISANAQGIELSIAEVELRCLLVNLIENAIEAGAGASPVTVRGELEGERVKITIEDSAGVVEESIRARFFEPFFSTKPHGTGLGLAIVQEVCRVYGGSVVANPTSQGTRLIVTLPVK